MLKRGRLCQVLLFSSLILLALPVLGRTADEGPGQADGPGGDSPPPAVRLRVLTYNIHHAAGVDEQLNVERISRVISAVDPDIVALQEVDRNVRRTANVDQPAEMARLTAMYVVFGGNIELQGGGYGNAVLSRFPIRSHANHRLPRFDDGEQRGVLDVEIEVPGTPLPLRFLATHLDHRRGDRERIASAKAIRELVAANRERPCLLAGDLNDVPGSPTWIEFSRDWTRTNADILATIPVGRPARQIDYVLYRPADRWRVVETRVLDEAIASDHRPLMAVLELLPAASVR